MPFTWESPTSKKEETNTSATAQVVADGVSFQAVISRIKTMADSSVRLEVDLPEIEPVRFALLYELRKKVINIVIK